MGRIVTTIPDFHHSVTVKECRLVKGITEVSIKNNKLQAAVKDGYPEDAYEAMVKQLRLIFAISFKSVFSENYQVMTNASGHHFTGHDELKAHLLARTSKPTPKFLLKSATMFEDMLQAAVADKQQTKLLNLMNVWARAQELQQLHLPIEAHVLLAKIADDMKRKGEFKDGKLMKGFGIVQTPGDQFAAKILQELGREGKESARQELDGFSYMYRLLARQADILDGEVAFYLGKKVLAPIENANAFLFEITRLYILWRCGLDGYYLKQQGMTYRIARAQKNYKLTY